MHCIQVNQIHKSTFVDSDSLPLWSHQWISAVHLPKIFGFRDSVACALLAGLVGNKLETYASNIQSQKKKKHFKVLFLFFYLPYSLFFLLCIIKFNEVTLVGKNLVESVSKLVNLVNKGAICLHHLFKWYICSIDLITVFGWAGYTLTE